MKLGKTIFIAVIASFAMSIAYHLLPFIYLDRTITISVGTSIYGLLYLRETKGRIGFISSLTILFLALVLVNLLAIDLQYYLLIHLFLLWLIRNLHQNNRIISLFIDSFVLVIAFALATWSMVSSHSIFISAWMFFICLYLREISLSLLDKKTNDINKNEFEDPFQQAFQRAENALQRMK